MAAILSAAVESPGTVEKNGVPSVAGSGNVYGAIRGQCVLPKYQNDSKQATRTSSVEIDHCVKPALIVWSLTTGKIVRVVSNDSDDDTLYDSEVERCLAEIDGKYDRSVYPMVFDNKDDFIVPGLIDINNTLCDVELGLTEISLESVCKDCIVGGVTTVVDLPKTVHHYDTPGGDHNFKSHCAKLESMLQNLNPRYMIDVVPFCPLAEHLMSGNDGCCRDARGVYASMVPIGQNCLAANLEQIQQFLKENDDGHVRPKSGLLFIHGETCSDKSLRIASPHRLLPCSTRYDPAFELKDHPTHMLGPISQGSSSNPGGVFGNGQHLENSVSPIAPYVANDRGKLSVPTLDGQAMSPMVQALERRRSVNVHGDWDKPIEELNVRPASSTTPVEMQHFVLNEQTKGTSRESTTASSLSSSTSKGSTKSRKTLLHPFPVRKKKTFYSTLLNSELDSYRYKVGGNGNTKKSVNGVVESDRLEGSRLRRKSPFQMTINTNSKGFRNTSHRSSPLSAGSIGSAGSEAGSGESSFQSSPSRFKSLSIATNTSASIGSNPSPSNSSHADLKYQGYSPPTKAFFVHQQKSSLLQRRANFSLSPPSNTTANPSSSNKQAAAVLSNVTASTSKTVHSLDLEESSGERSRYVISVFQNVPSISFIFKLTLAISIPENNPPFTNAVLCWIESIEIEINRSRSPSSNVVGERQSNSASGHTKRRASPPIAIRKSTRDSPGAQMSSPFATNDSPCMYLSPITSKFVHANDIAHAFLQVKRIGIPATYLIGITMVGS